MLLPQISVTLDSLKINQYIVHIYMRDYNSRDAVALWDFTQCIMVVVYRRFGTAYRLCLQGSTSPNRSQNVLFP
jgi:hypothetical protein